MSVIQTIVDIIKDILWDYVLIFLLLGTGIYFSFMLKFVQVKKLKEGLKLVFRGFSSKKEKANEDGMTSFQSLTTAIAAQVGTGNIAGAAIAIASGGAGAIFWMWVSAFFGMSTIFVEATLAQKYKKRVDEEITGGPVYYITEAFKGEFGKALSVFFAITIILALGFMGNMVQSNSIGEAFKTAFNINPIIVGIIVSLVAGFIFIGGANRIASFTEKIVPIMAILYVLGSIIILIMNFENLGNSFKQIFVLAFNPQAMAGGVVGATVKDTIRYGVAKGLFSNEAGMGSTPHAHARAKVKHPCQQGVVAIIGVFVDTFVVLTITALVIISTNSVSTGLTGAPLAQYAFNTAFGSFGKVFIAICMLFFAFSTIIGWYFFGEINVKYLFGKKAVKIYAILVMLFIALGSVLKVELVWSLSDMFNGFMVIPNLLALIALTSVAVKLYDEYNKEQK